MLKFNTGILIPSDNHLDPDHCWSREDLGELNWELLALEEEYDMYGPAFEDYPKTLEGTQQLYYDLQEWFTPSKYIQIALVYHQLLYNPLVYLSDI